MNATTTMTGNVGSAPEERTTKNGVPVTSFRLACTPRVLRAGEWSDGETMWLTVQAYRGLARNVAACVRTGDPVIVSGRLRKEAWTGSDGQPRERQVIEASVVGFDLNLGQADFCRASRAEASARAPEPPTDGVDDEQAAA